MENFSRGLEQISKNTGCELIARLPLMIITIVFGGLYGAILGIPMYSLWLKWRLQSYRIVSDKGSARTGFTPWKSVVAFGLIGCSIGMLIGFTLENFWLPKVYFSGIHWFVYLLTLLISTDLLVRLIAISTKPPGLSTLQHLYSELAAWTASISIAVAFLTRDTVK